MKVVPAEPVRAVGHRPRAGADDRGAGRRRTGRCPRGTAPARGKPQSFMRHPAPAHRDDAGRADGSPRRRRWSAPSCRGEDCSGSLGRSFRLPRCRPHRLGPHRRARHRGHRAPSTHRVGRPPATRCCAARRRADASTATERGAGIRGRCQSVARHDQAVATQAVRRQQRRQPSPGDAGRRRSSTIAVTRPCRRPGGRRRGAPAPSDQLMRVICSRGLVLVLSSSRRAPVRRQVADHGRRSGLGRRSTPVPALS